MVTATGTYEADDTVIVRYHTRDGARASTSSSPWSPPTGPPCSSTGLAGDREPAATVPTTSRRHRRAR